MRSTGIRWASAVAIGLGLWLCVVACSDDEEVSDYYCCVALSLCDMCGCGPNQSTANSGDEQKCKQFLDSGDWECVGGSEIDARNSCAGR